MNFSIICTCSYKWRLNAQTQVASLVLQSNKKSARHLSGTLVRDGLCWVVRSDRAMIKAAVSCRTQYRACRILYKQVPGMSCRPTTQQYSIVQYCGPQQLKVWVMISTCWRIVIVRLFDCDGYNDEIARVGGHYFVHGHSRSMMLVPYQVQLTASL